MPLYRSLLALALSVPFAAVAQQPAPSLPTYDVVSIHENKSDLDGMSIRWANASFIGTNITLAMLVENAYNIRERLISGLPPWADSFHFDLNAKVSDPDIEAFTKLTREQHRDMMLALLKDRFHLSAHIETKTLPVYDLVISKGGSKLKENSALPPRNLDPADKASNPQLGSFMTYPSAMTGIAIPLSALAANLAVQVERNVIDKTGLTGKYDIDLKWTPPEREGKADGLSDNPAPDLFTALQEQLGLKLEPSKGPVDILIVDHVEMPTAN